MNAPWSVDRTAPLTFLRTAYEPDDWIAVFLKSYETDRTTQRVGAVSLVAQARFQAWLRAENAARSNVYVSVNAITAGMRSRTREAICTVGHVFLEADDDGPRVVTTITARQDLPQPSYVLHSSPNRVHVFWRVMNFTVERVEALQKQLARELKTDPAATSCSQMTRLPGFINHKYRPGHLVTIDYGCVNRRYTPADFPTPITMRTPAAARAFICARPMRDTVARARRYVAAASPAVAGQHGDVHTFRLCCRLARGFALSDADALAVLVEWNVRCEPPWSERELLDKLRWARRYGREPIGGLLEARP